ncbi:hypothetical protein GGS23DRAFT_553089 [Durotheca rogersii]|uniref:uncharacterized protein n=1 Tax=Durotheca rogersii TaxID=419775 RepID=UPI00221FF20A|nr:uncharacterized protein GGS23DRAFT_553089 [Durotheca rogersii]KAI5867000.1 hypothetical protein GGS23DRAFT_553089 [Durotheca rogersii]
MVGRIDFQVKINDQRVEPGDSNTIIQTHSSVLNSSVVAASLDGKKALVAVIITKSNELEWSDLRNQLKELLKKHIPSYMVPTYWLRQEGLPLNVNGKVDIPRLVRHVQDLGRDYLLNFSTGSSTHQSLPNGQLNGHSIPSETEYRGSKLRDILAEVLSLPPSRISSDDTFQELGGSSLDAIRVSSKAHEHNLEISVADILKLSLRDLLNQTKPRETALSGLSTEPFSLLPPTAKLDRTGVEDAYPTTPLQDTFLANTLQGNTTYIYRRYYRVKGHHINVVKNGLENLLEQHPILRTTFVLNKTSFLQVVKKDVPLSWETLDITVEEFSSAKKRPMELGGPFVHFTSLRDGVLAVTMHHALFDYWSNSFYLDDLAAVLAGKSLQERPSHAHFVQHLLRQNKDELQSFWKSRLEGSYPCILGHMTEDNTLVSAELHEDVQTFASANKVSLGSLIYAAWAIVLSLHTNQSDVVFAATFSGRDTPVPGILKMAGPTITTVPFQARVDPDISLLDLARSIQGDMWECAPHAQLGLRNILKSSGHSSAPFDTMVNVLIKDSEGGAAKSIDILEQCAPFEPNHVEYTMLEAEPTEGVLKLRLLGSLTRIKANLLLGNVLETIKAILEKPSSFVGQLSPTSAEEEVFLNSISIEHPTTPNLFAYSLTEHMIARYPEKTALEDISGAKLSYRDFGIATNQLARYLGARGVGKGDIIPICMRKSISTLVAVFGILKSGAAFTPLDPQNPKDRNEFITKDVGAKVTITDSIHSGVFDAFSGEVINFDTLDTSSLDNSKVVLHNHSPQDLAYVIYTSGSTGLPKGVQVSHGAVAASTEGMIEACRVDHQWHVLWFLNYVFDASYFDVFTVLSSGGTISVADQDTLIADLASCVNRFGVTQMMLTPTISKLIAPDDVPTLKTLLVCGEPITPEVVETWATRMDVYNGYGPTEATILMTVSKVVPGGNLKSVGYPLKAVKASILHPNGMKPVPYGAVGELCVSGAQVAIGYLNRPEITAAAFQTAEDGSVVYRTGDYARWLPNGEIECLGRKDNQVKINGFRIELGEIENAVLSHAGDLIHSCVVGVAQVQRKKQIVVYYVPQDNQPTEDMNEGDLLYPAAVVDPAAILERLTSLAHYMAPKVFLPFLKFPLLPSGKINRKVLGALAEQLSPSSLAQYSGMVNTQPADYSEVLSDTEKILRDAWADLFDVVPESIIPSDLFYTYGGDSIAAINLVSMLRRQNFSLSVNDAVTYPTLREQATRLKPIKAAATQTVEFVVRPSVHQRLRDAGVAPEDVEEIYQCAPGQVEFLTQGHTESQFWQLMTVRPLPHGFDFDRWVGLTTKLTEINQILRAMYLKQDESDPLSWVQVILKKPVLDLAIVECADESQKTTLVKQHWDRMFELGRPFVRYLLLKHPDGSMDLCTKLDHAMYDGTLLRIFDDQFAALRDGRPVPKPTPFKTFVQYTHQNREEVLSFWREYLDGCSFTFPTQLSEPRVSSVVGATIDVPVNGFAQRAGVTASIAFQTAYSVLLSRLSGGGADVAYDYLLTGRNVDLDEPQLINGTCANFLPFRSRHEPGVTTVAALLRDTQSRFWQITENGVAGLGDIYHALGADRQARAAKTLFLFQPFEPAVGKQDTMRWIVMAMSKVTMFVNYAIMLEVFKDVSGGHRLKMGYDDRVFSKEQAAEVLDLYIRIVKTMVAGQAEKVSELL